MTVDAHWCCYGRPLMMTYRVIMCLARGVCFWCGLRRLRFGVVDFRKGGDDLCRLC